MDSVTVAANELFTIFGLYHVNLLASNLGGRDSLIRSTEGVEKSAENGFDVHLHGWTVSLTALAGQVRRVARQERQYSALPQVL